MKKYIVPSLLFVAVFLVSQFCQKYTLQFQESDGLFLFAPDYFRTVFSHPFPLSRIVTDFQTQFYRLSLVAPLLLGLETLAVFYILKSILSRFGLGADVFAAVPAAAAWLVTAHAASSVPLVATLLCLLPLWLVSRLVKPGRTVEIKRDAVFGAVAVLVIALAVVLSPKVRYAEKWAMVKNALVFQKYEVLCKKITPKAVQKDHELLPFVALAMGETGQLGENLFKYPVYRENDFDMCDEEDYYNSLFYRYLLYQNLGCGNEAVHNLFQLTVMQWHGSSFLTLRQLVTEYYKIGDFDMVEKYCKVLDRSLLHRKFTAYFRNLMAQGEPAEDTPAAIRSTLPLITHNPLQNLLLLQKEGMTGPSALDRILTTLLLQRKIELFGQMLEANKYKFETMPRHYQEAIAVYLRETDTPLYMYPILPDPPVLGRFKRFSENMIGDMSTESQQKEFGNTYWFYFYYME